MFFLRMAFLSILKHRRRSMVICISIVVSVVVMVFVQGMLGGLRKSFFDELLQDSGHLQIHGTGWENRLDPNSLAVMLRKPQMLIHDIQADPGLAAEVSVAEPMLRFGALLVHGERSVEIAGEGVIPETRFYSDVRSATRSGSFLPATGGPVVALSTSTARLLDLGTGDSVVALVQDATGSPYYLSYTVAGIFSTGKPQIDDELFFMPLTDAQALLGLPDEVSEIRLTIRHPQAAPAVARQLSTVLGAAHPFVQTWGDIQGGLVQLIRLGDLYSSVIDLIVVLVAATVITSSILMTIFERAPTFGALRAIGMKRRQLFGMLMQEGFLLGLAGSFLGICIGLLPVLYLQDRGLDVGAAARVLGTATTYRFALSARDALAVAAAGVLIAMGGYLYGALASVRTGLLESLDQGV